MLYVGASYKVIPSDDSMTIAGGILPAKLDGQEGEFRINALCIRGIEKTDVLCIISCDVIMLPQTLLDPAVEEIVRRTGIQTDRIMITATHTHHAPSTMQLHGYGSEEIFTQALQEAIPDAAEEAWQSQKPAIMQYQFSNLEIGRNSRLLLENRKILWVPQNLEYTQYKPTGPFDSELPVLSFKEYESKKMLAILFVHSCHNIGSISGKRSPGFYGIAAQKLSKIYACPVLFCPGASGSSHDFTKKPKRLAADVVTAVRQTIDDKKQHQIHQSKYTESFYATSSVNENTQNNNSEEYLSCSDNTASWRRLEVSYNTEIMTAAIKKKWAFSVRYFNEKFEEEAVAAYCRSMDISDCGSTEEVIQVFKKMRRHLADKQGSMRKTWLQVMRIGSTAIVAVPGELFSSLGLLIKKLSPFPHTIVIELANDAIGYIPDKEAFSLGGYQIWTGYHSFMQQGDGERMVEEFLTMLDSIWKEP